MHSPGRAEVTDGGIMILRRIAEHLKAQNWTAVGLDLAIVIVGVFIGTQVSNWNQSRIEKRETARLLGELEPALQGFADYFDTAGPYYATTRDWSDTAFAGWRGDRILPRQPRGPGPGNARPSEGDCPQRRVKRPPCPVIRAGIHCPDSLAYLNRAR